ncbi:MAG: DNA polymerase III subunit delta [Spirochaetales bacterium]|nr:DNA polymerase III subunit delta [Spirochaetales bacterium]
MTDNLCYLFLGPEVGEKDQQIQALLQSIEKRINSKPEIYKYFGFETRANDVLSLLGNQLLFADFKAVIIQNTEKMGKPDLAALAEYCKKPAAQSMLILCSDEIGAPDSRIDKAIPAKNKKIFWEMLDQQKRGWIINFFSKRKIVIDEDSIDLILDVVESNSRDLKTICERLEIFFGKEKTIRYADIENFVYHSKEENVFTLFAGLMKKDFTLSLEICNKILLSQGIDPVRIVNGLVWQFRVLLNFHHYLSEGLSPEQSLQKLSIRSKRRQKILLEGKKNFSYTDIMNIIQLIAEYDVAFRSFSTNVHQYLLELCIYKIIKKSQ